MQDITRKPKVRKQEKPKKMITDIADSLINEPDQKGFPIIKWDKPYGWTDLGEMKTDNKGMRYSHSFCNTFVRIGKENGNIFRFCPMCMVRTNNIPSNSN
ncbi:MAG: hypothetical protein HC798_04755 [Polaribacter sp.]|nr:hypothetical protein [Polaribacter sp.]